eukprot:Nitzschia sp. Nitz4//scaffold32_size149145//57036//58256//NITZ4_002876-RA/size149145-processed-gene-0.122-mRNA-1//-1//CDS//3329548060//3618//frame0
MGPSPFTPEERNLQKLLGEGAYHLPGNNWVEDWKQYFANNHPLFAPCLQHELHPISKWMRSIGILGSIMVGLVITNVMYLLWIQDYDDEETIFKMSGGGFAVHDGTEFVYLEDDSIVSQYTTVEVSKGMAILWSVGSAAHALFDNTIWYATSCTCLDSQEGRFAWIGKHRGIINVFVVLVVVLITAVATLAVVIRATVEGGGDLGAAIKDLKSAGMDAERVKDKSNYEFLLSYIVELALAWFLWFPIIETILFSGILSCGGRIACLGGRPQELLEEETPQGSKTELSKALSSPTIEDPESPAPSSSSAINSIPSGNTSSKKPLSSSSKKKKKHPPKENTTSVLGDSTPHPKKHPSKTLLDTARSPSQKKKRPPRSSGDPATASRSSELSVATKKKSTRKKKIPEIS